MNPSLSRRTVTASLLAGAAVLGTGGAAAAAPRPAGSGPTGPRQEHPRPTFVLVHGAFADASSWDGVIRILQQRGHRALAPALPLRGLAGDAAYIRSVLDSVPGPVVLVGHSYGGSVISKAADGASEVRALVYVAAFVPEVGESALELTDRFPGSTLANATAAQTYPLPGGGVADELVIKQGLFREQFADGVPVATSRVMAATQRPIALAALQEKATAAAWKGLPSWYLVATQDRNIPRAAQEWMAERAQAQTVRVRAPHAAAVTDPAAVAHLVLQAGRAAC